MPQSMTKSVLVPVIKDKNKRGNDNCNYRPICISNICSKLVEVVLFNRMQTSFNQFGFKPMHGTELRVFAFKELLRYYVNHGSCILPS